MSVSHQHGSNLQLDNFKKLLANDVRFVGWLVMPGESRPGPDNACTPTLKLQ